jgi:hypothetical protein
MLCVHTAVEEKGAYRSREAERIVHYLERLRDDVLALVWGQTLAQENVDLGDSNSKGS